MTDPLDRLTDIEAAAADDQRAVDPIGPSRRAAPLAGARPGLVRRNRRAFTALPRAVRAALALSIGLAAGGCQAPAGHDAGGRPPMVGQVPLDQHWRPHYELARERMAAGDAGPAVETFRTMAAAGLPRGLYELGKAYRHGHGVDQDPVRAAELFEQAAALPSSQQAYAAYHLGQMTRAGQGVRRDPARARQLFEQALSAGYTGAAAPLGVMLVDGDGGPSEPERGRLLLERAAAEGDAEANLALADRFASERHARAAVEILGARLAEDDAEAGDRLWRLHQEGRWRDRAAAERALRRTAELGHPPALAALGELHLQEASDLRQATIGLALLRQAAEQGDVVAMRALGRALLDGGSLEPQPGEALRWLQAAAERGDPHAHAELGMAFLDGRGVARDLDRAVEHLGEASRADLDYAAAALGRALLEAGRQPTRAFRLLETAAADGDRSAMMTLGQAYRDGRAVPRDPERGLDWFRRAERAGHPGARHALAGLLFGQGRERRSIAMLQEAAERGHTGAMMELADLELARVKQGAAPDHAIAWLERAVEQGHPGADRALGRVLLATARSTGAAAATMRTAVSPSGSTAARSLLEAASEAGSARAQMELADVLIARPRSPADRDRGLALLEAAARDGNVAAMTRLARAHLDGDHPLPDAEQAITWLERAAGGGHVHAMAMLGDVYLSGDAGRPDGRKAIRWLEAAADAGSATAAATLGRALVRGEQVGPAPERGVALLERAAAQGNLGAKASLGRILLFGENVPQDIERGVDLLFMAALEGHPSAKASLGRAYLQSKGLAGVSSHQASAWLERVMAVEPDVALKTLKDLLKGLPEDRRPVDGEEVVTSARRA